MIRIVALVLAFASLAAILTAPALAETEPAELRSLIRDPDWQKRFLGSYGFLSGAEPQVNATELELLREVIDLMSANPRAAAEVLKQNVGAESSAALDFVLANLLFQNDELDAALEKYRSAIEKFPDFRRAHKNMGLLLLQRSDCKQAVTHLSKAVELGDRDGRNYGLMGYCYVQLENPLAAQQAYRNAILQQPDTRDWRLGLARALLATEQYKEAIAQFDALIAEQPDDKKAWLAQANAYVGSDQPMAAAVNLEAVRLLGGTESSSLVLLGDIYMNEGMTELARDAYLEVIESDREAVKFGTAYRAADLLIRTRAFADAEAILAKIDQRYAKGLNTDDELKLLTLQARTARARGREKEAAQLLESIVARDGTRGDALMELAAYHHSQGNLEKALMLIERAENLEDFEYGALLAHARFLVSSRDYDKAAQLLRRALQIRSEPRVESFLARVDEAARR